MRPPPADGDRLHLRPALGDALITQVTCGPEHVARGAIRRTPVWGDVGRVAGFPVPTMARADTESHRAASDLAARRAGRLRVRAVRGRTATPAGQGRSTDRWAGSGAVDRSQRRCVALTVALVACRDGRDPESHSPNSGRVPGAWPFCVRGLEGQPGPEAGVATGWRATRWCGGGAGQTGRAWPVTQTGKSPCAGTVGTPGR
jgi:hypothetical protein